MDDAYFIPKRKQNRIQRKRKSIASAVEDDQSNNNKITKADAILSSNKSVSPGLLKENDAKKNAISYENDNDLLELPEEFQCVVDLFNALCTLSTAAIESSKFKDYIVVTASSLVSSIQKNNVLNKRKEQNDMCKSKAYSISTIGALFAILGEDNMGVELIPSVIEKGLISRNAISMDNIQVCILPCFGRIKNKSCKAIEIFNTRHKIFQNLLRKEFKLFSSKLSGQPRQFFQLHYSNIIYRIFEDAQLSFMDERIRYKQYDSFSIDRFLEDSNDSSFKYFKTKLEYSVIEPKSEKFADNSMLGKLTSCPLAKQILECFRIEKYYEHQVDAINAIEKGMNVTVTTATCSGKSLIYTLPTAYSIINNKAFENCKIIQIYPTKSLAQNQYEKLEKLSKYLKLINGNSQNELKPHLFDGDVNQSNRQLARMNGNILLTNADMLHLSFLHNHGIWKDWISNLKYVIWDEVHYYDKLLGMQCAMINRRLKRLAKLYGNNSLQFICCSATISNPLDFSSKFLGVPPELIQSICIEGGFKSRKLVGIFKNKNQDFTGESSNPEDNSLETYFKEPKLPYIERTILLLEYFIRKRIRVICFAKVRKTCEILATRLKYKVKVFDEDLSNKIFTYRGGYVAQDRREIESSIFKGDAVCVICTNALEVGVDIGTVDVVVHCGYPSSLASYRQQAGRCGRRGLECASIIVEDDGNIHDRYRCTDLNDLSKDKCLPPTIVEFQDSTVLRLHIQCAAFESPLYLDELNTFNLEEPDKLAKDTLRFDPHYEVFHHDNTLEDKLCFPIRGIQSKIWELVSSDGKLLETMEETRTVFCLYLGGIFIHKGESYEVIEINHEFRKALLRFLGGISYYTTSRDYTDADPVKPLFYKEVLLSSDTKFTITMGDVEVRSQVFGYNVIDKVTRKIKDSVAGLDNYSVLTGATGVWLDLNSGILCKYRILVSLEFSIHTVAHALINISSMKYDLRTECKHLAAKRYRPPRILLFEMNAVNQAIPSVFDQFIQLLDRAFFLIKNCKCKLGCYNCIFLPNCSEGNTALSKAGGIEILSAVLGK